MALPRHKNRHFLFRQEEEDDTPCGRIAYTYYSSCLIHSRSIDRRLRNTLGAFY